MISGANEEELELATARMDIMLATNYTTENPGPLAIIDKYYDKEIERLNNIIDELEKYILNHYIVGHQIQNASLDGILNKLKELKEGK